ncbi:MAG: hypothetical protein KKA16_09910 [Alphaproteobacteria bacterium]|uniref:Uncharacterized protein n=1 Tax=viral metagenome TaxID=1070528 RepID=A0A6H1ZJD8_9ZZZZ|nr:hypothetical protein [Alphaproteobacteria bacterium]MBU2377871.1 hypothetical protein [Alphaproteobacteria bacterium]
MAASDYVSETLEFTLALKGASTDGKRTLSVLGHTNCVREKTDLSLGPAIAPLRRNHRTAQTSSVWSIEAVRPAAAVVDPGTIQTTNDYVFGIGGDRTGLRVDFTLDCPIRMNGVNSFLDTQLDQQSLRNGLRPVNAGAVIVSFATPLAWAG